jgi:hypothetical protein
MVINKLIAPSIGTSLPFIPIIGALTRVNLEKCIPRCFIDSLKRRLTTLPLIVHQKYH